MDSQLRNMPLVGDNEEVDTSTGNVIGSWGIKQTYVQNTPAANFPPINYKQYAGMLVFDTFIKGLFAEKERCPSGSNVPNRKAETRVDSREQMVHKPLNVPVPPIPVATITSMGNNSTAAALTS